MINEAIGSLNLKSGQIVLDATVGGGGHAEEILKKIGPQGRLIGLDADREAIDIAANKLAGYAGSFKLINENFRKLDKVLSEEKVKQLDAALFDLGISSYQIESNTKGFSIRHDARLDMRMDARLDITAYDIVNRYRENDLAEIINTFGEERFYRKVARRIILERETKPIETTHELAEIVRRAVGFSYRKSKIDPATRTFQALRIAVNDELAAAQEGIKSAVSWLGIGARICVISFHSLEDRIVKRLFKAYAGLGILKVITKKPMTPQDAEVRENPRARSAKLRAAERI